MTGRARIGELMVELGVISDAQLRSALDEQIESRQRLGAILVAHGACDEAAVAKAIARQSDVRYVPIERIDVPPDVIAIVPRELALRQQIVPLKVGRRGLIIATTNPPGLAALDEIAFQVGHAIEYLIATETGIRDALERYYDIRADRERLSVDAPIEIVVAEPPAETAAASDEAAIELGAAAGSPARDDATGGLDERLRRSLGEAESDGTGMAWARATVALARAGLFTRAEQAHARAIAEGFATAEIDHVLEWGSLGEISARELGARYERPGTLGGLAFDPSRRVVLARRGDKLDELDAVTGEVRELPLPPLVGPFAIDPRGGRVACVFANPSVLVVYDVAKGTVGRRLRLEQGIDRLAFLPGGFLVFGTANGLHGIRSDALGHHRPQRVISKPSDGGGFVIGRSAIYSWRMSGEIFQHAAPRFERRPFVALSPSPWILEQVPSRVSPNAGRLVAAGEACGLITRSWSDGRWSEEVMRTFTADGRARRSALYPGLPSPSGRYVATSLRDKLEILDSETRDLATFELGRPIEALSWSPGGRELAVALAETGTVLLVGPKRPGEKTTAAAGPWLTVRRGPAHTRARAAGCGVEYERNGQTGVVICASAEQARERAPDVLTAVAHFRWPRTLGQVHPVTRF